MLLLAFEGHGQSPNRFWNAHWIDVPGAPPHDYGVYHFRRTFELPAKPGHFVVRVSGDNRYELFVNGKRLAFGPARGDLTHWRYETVDIAPALAAGKNVLAAVVWNDGAFRAIAQVSNQTGFLLDGNGDVNTGSSWKCMVDRAYSPQPLAADQRTGYYALAANERFDASRYPWGWETAAFDDSAWPTAHEIGPAAAREARDSPNRWMLVAREIPLEEQFLEHIGTVRKAEGVTASETFLHGGPPLTIPAHSTASVLIDQGYLTTAYPELTVSGGAGAGVDLAYAETLYVRKDVDKGNRNDVEGKQFYGPADTYLADGGAHRIYRPLFWRTYRYLQLRVNTSDARLVVEDLHGTFTAFPFERKAQLEVGDPATDKEIQQILGTGWRSARLCAHETYMDCPFYEQLQYAGDARIQMLVSLYTAGDARLMKNGIALRVPDREQSGSIMRRVLDDPSLAQSSIYFRAYTNAALREAGVGDRYLNSLGPWREMLKQGLTTWAEWDGPDARSDSHAWGASPNFELFRTMAGIEPIAPGFRRVRVAPHLGDLKHLAARMPHPKGEIQVDFTHENPRRLAGDVTLPPGITGILEWAGVSQPLHKERIIFRWRGDKLREGLLYYRAREHDHR